MNKIQRFWSHEAKNIRCVRESDYDALHAEAEALRAENGRLSERDEFGLFCANCGKPLARDGKLVTGPGVDHEEVCCSDFCHDEHERLGCPQGAPGAGFRDAEWYGRLLYAAHEHTAKAQGHALDMGQKALQAAMELGQARGLLGELHSTMAFYFPGDNPPAHEALMARVVAYLAVTPATEVRTQPLSGNISDQDWINAGCPREASPPAQDVSGLVEALEEIVKQYPNPDISHVAYRVHACRHAEQALAAYRNPATVKRCPTCPGTCAEICKEARP